LDEIDWAAMRLVIPAILRHADPGDFQTVTGFDLDALRPLLEKAQRAIRRVTRQGHRLRCEIGDCAVEIPVRRVGTTRYLAAVPDFPSWDKVVPACAVGHRDDFLLPIWDYFENHQGTRIWEERACISLEELEEWVMSEARPFEAELEKRRSTRPAVGRRSPPRDIR